MKPWEKRPVEIRNLFNPAFCGLVLHRSVSSYTEANEHGMPFSLSLLVLPLCLQKNSRDILQAGNRSYLLKIIAQHPEMLVGFARRCTDVLPFTLEGLGLLMSFGALKVTERGNIVPGENRVIKAINGSDETRSCQKVAGYIGKQFASIGDRATVYASLGVRP